MFEENIQILDNMDEFYSKRFFFSYSSLKTLIWNPKAFKIKYIDNVREEKTDKHLLKGKAVHCLMLEQDLFEDKFVVSPITIPSGNNKKVIDRVFSEYISKKSQGFTDPVVEDLIFYSSLIVEYLREIDLHQSLKTDGQRLDKILTEENNNYFEYLKKKGSRDVIDQEMYEESKYISDLLKSDPKISQLMGLNEERGVMVINEVELRSDLKTSYGKYPFGLKGIIDNLVIDHNTKKIYINDLKTTDNLSEFVDTLGFFKYWLQAAIYFVLVVSNYRYLIELGFEVKFNFIVVDKLKQFYTFPVSDKSMIEWIKELNGLLDKAEYHYTNRRYDLPYEFCKEEIVL